MRYTYGKDGGTTIRDRWETQEKLVPWQLPSALYGQLKEGDGNVAWTFW